MGEMMTANVQRWIMVWSAVKPRAEPCASRREFHFFNGRMFEEAVALDVYRAMKPRRMSSLPSIKLAWGREALEDRV
jgi:hypothetical protein